MRWFVAGMLLLSACSFDSGGRGVADAPEDVGTVDASPEAALIDALIDAPHDAAIDQVSCGYHNLPCCLEGDAGQRHCVQGVCVITNVDPIGTCAEL